ncbi:hypothetical protein ACTXT7_011740 [Hymenolepis weldensis]
MFKRAHRFPPFYISLFSPKRHICAHVLTIPYPSDSHYELVTVTAVVVCQLQTFIYTDIWKWIKTYNRQYKIVKLEATIT